MEKVFDEPQIEMISFSLLDRIGAEDTLGIMPYLGGSGSSSDDGLSIPGTEDEWDWDL